MKKYAILVFSLLGDVFGNGVVLLPVEHRAFARSADGQNARDAVLDLEIDQLVQTLPVDGIALERRDECGVAASFHFFPLTALHSFNAVNYGMKKLMDLPVSLGKEKPE